MSEDTLEFKNQPVDLKKSKASSKGKSPTTRRPRKDFPMEGTMPLLVVAEENIDISRNEEDKTIETPPATLDVLEHKEEIFRFLSNNDGDSLASLWGEFKLVPQGPNEIYNGTYTTRNAYIEAASAYISVKERWNLINSVIKGPSAFQYSGNAYVDTSLILSNNALSGTNLKNLNIDNEEDARDYICSNPTIINSVIDGMGVLENAKDGLINGSIIKGERALANSRGMTLKNTYVFGPDGIYYFENRKFDRFILDPKCKIQSFNKSSKSK